MLATLSNLGSLFLYTIAYCLWFFASRMYPDYPRKAQSWYGFTEFKNQHIIAVVLGVTAIISCLAALSMPLAIIPATWLFASSNGVWCTSEYHKNRIHLFLTKIIQTVYKQVIAAMPSLRQSCLFLLQ
ncbi:hypothetical protein [Legionella tunisiensis]|uniref:hypothetical protein n=1 Tax=Legionella tunisiensis TaxID=1034944 RepID=UPI0012EAB420|nr:hypothetical protein [Legionella tunisiensis]